MSSKQRTVRSDTEEDTELEHYNPPSINGRGETCYSGDDDTVSE